MPTIIVIHGINNEDNTREDIQREWMDALRAGAAAIGKSLPNSLEVRTAYYADVLKSGTDTWGQAREVSTPMGPASSPDDFADRDVAQLYAEYQRAFDLSDAQVAAELSPDEDRRYQTLADGIHKSWLKAIARALEKVIPSAAKPVARRFLRQAAAYLHRPGLKEQIDDLVLSQVFRNPVPDANSIVIAHSLGTIVAFDLLRRLRHDMRAKLLVTCGSPLGIDMVKQRLGPPLACLPNVQRWINIADPEDFVALRKRLDATSFGCGKIENFDNVDNGKADAHDIRQYLKHRPAVEAVLAALH